MVEMYIFYFVGVERIYRTIILPVILYGCKTWSLTLREEHRLRVFENRVLRRIFGPVVSLYFKDTQVRRAVREFDVKWE
jgi:hypothetical protein